MRKMRDGIMNHKLNKAMVIVQKFLKGYLISKDFEHFYV